MSITALIAIVVGLLMLLTPFIAYNSWQKTKKLTRRADFLESLTWVLLKVDVPRNNEKTPLAAEQLFSSIHGILRDDRVVQEHISFEIVANSTLIQFYIFMPTHLQDFIEGQIYAQYPDVHIEKIEDYAQKAPIENMVIAQTEMTLTKEDVYPIRTFTNFEVDPLAGITAVLSKLGPQEQVWLQFCVRPVGDEWQKRGLDLVKKIRSGSDKKKSGMFVSLFKLLGDVGKEIVRPNSAVGAGESKPVELAGPVVEALGGIENKATKLGYEVIMRV
ncbi:MAG: hypothetical protein Q7S64_03440, partial [bacterium]|nr:hypothetical protein [bacterium]